MSELDKIRAIKRLMGKLGAESRMEVIESEELSVALDVFDVMINDRVDMRDFAWGEIALYCTRDGGGKVLYVNEVEKWGVFIEFDEFYYAKKLYDILLAVIE